MAAVKVLVVDDSPIMQKLLVSMLSSDNRLQVVGLATNGEECVQKTIQLKPQVILLDLEMPILDGPNTLIELSKRNLDVAVLIVCDFAQKDSAHLKSALDAGAFDYFVKPKSTMEIDKYQRQVITKIFVASFTKTKQIPKRGDAAPEAPLLTAISSVRSRKYTVIGCSTGGKQSLSSLLPLLTDQCSTSILVVIQQPAFIVNQFIKEMKTSCKLPVGLVQQGSELHARHVLLAPTGSNDLVVERFVEAGGDVIRVGFVDGSADAMVNHPCMDRLFESAAAAMKQECMGIVLSGTGKDGVAGLKAIQRVKGLTIAEDKATATVSQLPLEAAKEKAADEVLPIKGIAERMNAPL
jgi:two-component system chemotaxis response regulator CheB